MKRFLIFLWCFVMALAANAQIITPKFAEGDQPANFKQIGDTIYISNEKDELKFTTSLDSLKAKIDVSHKKVDSILKVKFQERGKNYMIDFPVENAEYAEQTSVEITLSKENYNNFSTIFQGTGTCSFDVFYEIQTGNLTTTAEASRIQFKTFKKFVLERTSEEKQICFSGNEPLLYFSVEPKDGYGNRYKYQWQERNLTDWKNLEGKNGATLTPSDLEVGEKNYRVVCSNINELDSVLFTDSLNFNLTVIPKIEKGDSEIHYVKKSDKEFSFSVKEIVSPINGGKWSYKWSRKNKDTGAFEEIGDATESSYSFIPEESYEEYRVNVRLVDDNEEYLNETLEGFVVKFYDKFEVAAKDRNEKYLSTTETEPLTLAVELIGGYDGEDKDYSYEWFKDSDSNPVGTDPTFVVVGKEPGNRKYLVKVKNKKGDATLAEAEISFIVHVYEPVEAKAESSPEQHFVLESEKTVTFVVTPSKGYGDTYTYQWTGKNNPVSSDTNSYTPSITEAGDYTYECVVKNTVTIDDKPIDLGNAKVTFTLHVYNKLEATLAVDQDDVYSSDDNCEVVYKSGRMIKLKTAVEGGLPDKLTGRNRVYELFLNDTFVKQNSDGVFDFSCPNVGENKYKVTVSDKKDSDTFATHTASYTVKVYPEFKITATIDYNEIFTDGKATITIEAEDGIDSKNGGSWEPTLQDGEGLPLSLTKSGSKYSCELINLRDGTFYYNATAINKKDKKTMAEATASMLTLSVYPSLKEAKLFIERKDKQPSDIVMDGQRVDIVMDGQRVTYVITGLPEANYKYIWDSSKEHTSKEYVFNAKNGNNDGSMEEQKIEVEITRLNKNGDAMGTPRKVSKKVNVYKEPNISEIKSSPEEAYAGMKLNNVSCTISGGDPEHRIYQWYMDDALIQNQTEGSLKDYSVPEDIEVSDSGKKVTYKLKVIDKIGGLQNLEKTAEETFVMMVYPKPQHTITAKLKAKDNGNDVISNDVDVRQLDIFNDDKVEYTIRCTGGKPGTWIINGESTDSIKLMLSANADSLIQMSNNDYWYNSSETLNLSVKEFPKLDSKPNQNSIDIYADGNKTLDLGVYLPTDINENEWTYNWSRDEVEVEGTGASYSEEIALSSEKQISTYCVRARWTLNSGSFRESTLSWNVTRWPKATVDFSAAKYKKQVREGDHFEITGISIEGGFDGGWKSEWTCTDHEPTTKHNSVLNDVLPLSTDEGMGTKTVTYTLTATNKCGDTQWFNESNNYQVTVYRKPRTPSSLKKKGNGSSKILVFDFDSLNDEELSGYNYKFVYGYTDSAGDHWKGQTNKRYFQADDINLRYYVFSVWDYGNDIKVTSDKRYLDKTSVDPFDGCNFPDNNVTRSGDSDLSAIRDASVGSFQAKGAHLVAYFPTPVSGIISICDVNGNAVRQQRLHGSSYYDVQADLSGLKSGMYLIRYAVGNQEQTEKVIVK